jgi:hypothetical protein
MRIRKSHCGKQIYKMTLVVHALNDACLLFRVSTLGVA